MDGTTKVKGPAIDRFRRLRFLLLALWVTAIVLAGAVLMSQHQPFRVAEKVPLALLRPSPPGSWRAVHILSGSCGCSQRVMEHLVHRHPLNGFEEEVTVIDDGTPYLPDSPRLLVQLQNAQIPVRHLRLEDLPRDAGLYGVPMLVVVSPPGRILYAGGYGTPENDVKLLQRLRAGQHPAPLAVVGCAVGRTLQRKVDPFQVKYSTVRPPLAFASVASAGLSRKGTR